MFMEKRLDVREIDLRSALSLWQHKPENEKKPEQLKKRQKVDQKSKRRLEGKLEGVHNPVH